MSDNNETVSVARLMSRKKYYQEKALTLEKEMIFAQEQLTTVEEKLVKMQKDTESYKKKYETANNQLQELTKDYKRMAEEYGNLREQADVQLNKVETGEQKQQKSVANENQVRSYERLLNEVQQSLNEREEELFIYKRRLKMLEKRLNAQGQGLLKERPSLSKKEINDDELRAIAYADFAYIIKTAKSCQIRGSIYIENIGGKALGQPYVCFRFNPGDLAEVRGRILKTENLQESKNENQEQWQFLDNDWSEEARDRGEIWVHPVQPINLGVQEKLTLRDFQIPLQNIYHDYVTIELFVYFQETAYRIKSLNQMLINFKP